MEITRNSIPLDAGRNSIPLDGEIARDVKEERYKKLVIYVYAFSMGVRRSSSQ
jgi:hypothetical protein